VGTDCHDLPVQDGSAMDACAKREHALMLTSKDRAVLD
jgi:hypothetical protein